MHNMRRPVALASLVVGFATLIAVSGQQSEPLDIQEIKNNLYMITGPGGNVGVRVSTDGVVLIDNKFDRNHDAIMSTVQTVTSQPVTYVIGTHHHGDHMGGNPLFSTHADIIGHQNNRANMVRGDQPAPPNIVFADETAIFLGGVEVRAYHFGRGHTNGDAVVYFPDLRTIHGGDLLHGTAPFIDYANGGSSRAWVSTLDALLELDWDTAIPGHGEVMTRRDVQDFQNQMVNVRSRMSELIESGVSREDAPTRLRTNELSWTMAEEGLFMRRSIPGFYDEMSAER